MKRINLLPQALRPRKDTGAFFRWFTQLVQQWPLQRSPGIRYAAVVIGFLGVVMCWQGTAIWRYRFVTSRLQKELQQLRRSSAELKTKQQALNVQRAELLATREQLETKRAALQQARQPRVQVSTAFAELVEALPDDAWIAKLSFDGEHISLVGATLDAQAVANVMAKLDGSQRFSQTQFTSTQRAGQAEGATFMFEITTKPVLQEGGT